MDADIVHATFQTIAPVVYIRKPRRFVVTVHDLIPLLYPSVLKGDLSMRLQWMLTPHALKKVNGIITNSEFTRREVIRLLGIDASKVYTVLHATTKYKPMNKKKCKQKLGLSISEKHILVVASNNANKRMDLTRRIYEDIRKRRDDIKLIKAGYAETLSGEGIINVGRVSEDEMAILYNSADVFLNTSEYEGFGMPIVEAMSCGVPVVASNKASIPEVMGTYGNMVDLDAGDVVERFVDKILSCIDMGFDERALEQSKNFSWESTVRGTIRVYEKLLGGS
jgi:glycosyltransferase involved in cell wall biosynthesis